MTKMTEEEVEEFNSNNGESIKMMSQATLDYASARCLLLNYFFNGLTLASQSIEKLLKSLILLETNKRETLKGPDRHNPFKLKEELKQTRDYNLDKFDDLLKQLYGHYQLRYPDNIDRSTRRSIFEINEIDVLWLYIFENMPVPPEVKYRRLFFYYIFDDAFPYDSHTVWLKKDNIALSQRFSKLKSEYNEAING